MEYLTSGLYRVEDYEKDEELRVSDLKDVSEYFKTYWMSIQPTWRQSSTWPPSQTASGAGDWSCLTKGGPDGLYVVIKMLNFWLLLRWYGDEIPPYTVALTDVHWTLGEVLKQLNGGDLLPKRCARACK